MEKEEEGTKYDPHHIGCRFQPKKSRRNEVANEATRRSWKKNDQMRKRNLFIYFFFIVKSGTVVGGWWMSFIDGI